MRERKHEGRWTGQGFKSFLLELREIGWSEWDPIGLADSRSHCEDEYDNYLLAACGQIANGIPQERIVAYLVRIETDHMGIQNSKSATLRAEAAVSHIAALLRD